MPARKEAAPKRAPTVPLNPTRGGRPHAQRQRKLKCHVLLDKYLIFAGLAYIVPKSALLEAIAGYEVRRGGDLMKSLGVCLPLAVLEGSLNK